MIENDYLMTVQFETGISPYEFTESIIEEWKKLGFPELFYTSKSALAQIDLSTIKQKLKYGSNQSVALKLKTGTTKNDDNIELYFTNPNWDLIQTNYCRISFSNDKISSEQTGYSSKTLLSLFIFLLENSYIKSGFFESSLIKYDKELWRFEENIAKKRGRLNWPQFICWFTFIPKNVFNNRLKELLNNTECIDVIKEIKNGYVIRTKDRPYEDYEDHKKLLINVNKVLTII